MSTGIIKRWSQLPADVQKTIDQAKFDSWNQKKKDTLVRLSETMKKDDLWKHVGTVTNVWTENTGGLEAKSSISQGKSLVRRLLDDSNYCRNTWPEQRLKGQDPIIEAQWRRLTSPGTPSLHAGPINRSYSVNEYRIKVHIDKVGVGKGRDIDGTCIYSIPHLITHLIRDAAGVGGNNIRFFEPQDHQRFPPELDHNPPWTGEHWNTSTPIPNYHDYTISTPDGFASIVYDHLNTTGA